MSNSRGPVSPDTNINPTRQMLDELDALMERMLSLPVNDAEAELPPASPAATGPPEVDAFRHDAGLELPRHGSYFEGLPGAGVSEVPSTEVPYVPSPAAGIQGPHLRPGSPAKIIVGRLSAPPLTDSAPSSLPAPNGSPHVAGDRTELEQLVPPPLPEVAPELARSSPVPHRSPFDWLIKALVPMNQAFDYCTVPLGAAGTWLRSTAGRHLIGWAGLALLALASVWYLHDWLGWSWAAESLK